MALPKKKINVVPQKSGQKQVQELLEGTNEKSTFLPRSILLEDLDRGMFDFVKDAKLSIDIDGKKVPVVFLTNERWAEFEKTWKFSDDDNAAVMPFITVRRVDAPKPGTNPVTKYGVPERAKFTYIKVPTLDNGVRGVDIYQIPQPVAVDVDYEVRFFTHYMVDVNKFNELVNKTFYSRQAYANIKGHYIPIIMNGVTDESTMDTFDGQRYYNQSFNFTMLGYLQDEKEFKVVKGLRRTLVFNELGEDLTGEIDLSNGQQATFTKTEFLSAKGSGKSGSITRPGGSSGQVQFNFGGYFEGDPSFTFLNGNVNIVNLITTAITATTYYSGNTPLNDILSGVSSNVDAINLSNNGIFGGKAGSNLQFLGISAGTNVTITSGTSVLTISSTASGSGGAGFSGWTSSTGSNSIILNSTSNTAISAITIAGGSGNTTQGIGSGILWGRGNLISGNSPNSIIAGGSGNTITNNHSSILGGRANSITSIESAIVGGSGNTISSNRGFIGGGRANSITGAYSVVVGGDRNLINANRTFIGGGTLNTATGLYSIIVGGNNNFNSGIRTSIIGGRNNFINNNFTSIVGGYKNSSTTIYSFIANGLSNKISGGRGFIGAGGFNYINGYGTYGNGIITGNYNSISGNNSDLSFIGNGNRNAIVGLNSFIGTGFFNRIDASEAFLGGGRYNLVSGGSYSSILGGQNNTVLGNRSAIIGGKSNNISANSTYGFIGVGNGNNVHSQFGTILNGSGNTLTSTATNSTIISLSGFTGTEPHTVYMPFVISLFNLTATTYYSGSTPLNTILASISSGGGFTGWTNSSGSQSIIQVSTSANTSYSANSVAIGSGNTSNGNNSTIAGGTLNIINSQNGFIGGGRGNSISSNSTYATIVAGASNINNGLHGFIGAGLSNSLSSSRAVIVGGNSNTINSLAAHSMIGGGLSNTINSGGYGFIGAGQSNLISASRTFIGGGHSNSATSTYSLIVGGQGNRVSGSRSSIVGGRGNLASSTYSFIGGGSGNTATSIYSVLLGGKWNLINSQFGAILNGSGNTLTSTATNSVILGLTAFTGSDPMSVYLPNARVFNTLNVTGDSTFVTLAGTGDRMVQASSGGTISAVNQIISAYLTSGGTIANLLENTSNWDINGVYTGTTITGTYQGQKHYNGEYLFEAVADNLFIRLIRG